MNSSERLTTPGHRVDEAVAAPWMAAVLARLQVGVIVLDRANTVVFVNDWFLERGGLRADGLLGRPFTEAFDVSPAFMARLAAVQSTGFAAVLSHSLHPPLLPLYMPHLVGHPEALLSQMVHIMPLGRAASGQGGDAGQTLIQVTDVTPTVRREALLRTRVDQMHLMARVDALTGVGNRRAFTEALDTEVRAAIRAQSPLGLLMLDIDHFKRYNDHYGHLAGDQCLRDVAAVLQRVVRRPRDRLVRYGGEEFVILLPATPLEGALEVGREVLQQIRQLGLPHVARPDGERILTVSLGAASLRPHDPSDARALLAQADQALYAAKAAGRNRLHPEPASRAAAI